MHKTVKIGSGGDVLSINAKHYFNQKGSVRRQNKKKTFLACQTYKLHAVLGRWEIYDKKVIYIKKKRKEGGKVPLWSAATKLEPNAPSQGSRQWRREWSLYNVHRCWFKRVLPHKFIRELDFLPALKLLW